MKKCGLPVEYSKYNTVLVLCNTKHALIALISFSLAEENRLQTLTDLLCLCDRIIWELWLQFPGTSLNQCVTEKI